MIEARDRMVFRRYILTLQYLRFVNFRERSASAVDAARALSRAAAEFELRANEATQLRSVATRMRHIAVLLGLEDQRRVSGKLSDDPQCPDLADPGQPATKYEVLRSRADTSERISKPRGSIPQRSQQRVLSIRNPVLDGVLVRRSKHSVRSTEHSVRGTASRLCELIEFLASL